MYWRTTEGRAGLAPNDFDFALPSSRNLYLSPAPRRPRARPNETKAASPLEQTAKDRSNRATEILSLMSRVSGGLLPRHSIYACLYGTGQLRHTAPRAFLHLFLHRHTSLCVSRNRVLQQTTTIARLLFSLCAVDIDFFCSTIADRDHFRLSFVRA